MASTANVAITSRLYSEERLLWSGFPRGGLRLAWNDVFLIPFSLIWAGFAFFWEFSALGTKNLFYEIWGVPFVLMGAHITVGRFFWDAYRRSRTSYAVTDQRVIIVNEAWRGSETSLSLATLPMVEMKLESEGTGTLIFGEATLLSFFGPRGRPPQQPPSFDHIDDVRMVYDVIQKAQMNLPHER